jgi:hypothetical protein
MASKAGLTFVDLVLDGQHPLGLLHRHHPRGPTACVALLDSSTSTLLSMASSCAGLYLTPASALGIHCCQHPRWTFIVASIRAGLLLLALTLLSMASLRAGLVVSFSPTLLSTASVSCWTWA